MDNLIVGAGIAGVTSAYFLTKAGENCRLIDLGPESGTGASGNPFGLVYPYLSAFDTSISRLQEDAFAFFQSFIDQTPAHLACTKRPVLHFLTIKRLQSAFRAFVQERVVGVQTLDPSEMKKKFPRFSSEPALWIESGYVVEPKKLCGLLLENIAQQVNCHWNTKVIKWVREGAKIRVISDHEEWVVDRLILASGPVVNELLPQRSALALNGNLGQLVYLPHPFRDTPEADFNVCYNGYLTANIQGFSVLGASYQREPFNLSVTPGIEKQLAKQAEPFLGQMHISENVRVRASVRATTPDRCPQLGEVLPGVWVNTGHGSRGLVTAPFLSWCLVKHLKEGYPLPVSSALGNRTKRKKT